MEIFGIPLQAFLGQLLLGLVNGSFYAMLSLGLAVIFGLLGIVNFAHGALYMIGAYVAWYGLENFGLNYWAALVVAPLVVGAYRVASAVGTKSATSARSMLRRLRKTLKYSIPGSTLPRRRMPAVSIKVIFWPA